jgi:hypothetical protein
MTILRDMLIDWIDERTNNMLATPRAWGSDEAIEMQVLLLMEFRAFALCPEQEIATPGRVVDAYMKYLTDRYPTKPHRPLCQIVEPDHLGQNLAIELRKALSVFTATVREESGDESRVVRDRDAPPIFEGNDEFDAACKGDIDALQRLARRYSYWTFVLRIAGKVVECKQVRFVEDSIQYRIAEQYGHSAPLAEVEKSHVERLIQLKQ